MSYRIKVDVTSDAGSQYRCGQVGGGVQPPANPIPHPSHTNIHKKYPKCLLTYRLNHYQQTNGPTDQQTNGPKDKQRPLIELRVRN